MREFRSASTNIVIVFTMGWVGGGVGEAGMILLHVAQSGVSFL